MTKQFFAIKTKEENQKSKLKGQDDYI